MPLYDTLAQVLGEYLQRDLRSTHELSLLTAKPPSVPPKVPQRTIANWLSGHSRRPRHWRDLLKIAIVLRLTETEANRLLQAGGHEIIPALVQLPQSSADQLLLRNFRQLAPQAQAKTPTPFQPIADLPYFVGRKQEMQQLSEDLLHNGRATICGVRGMGGVGKTMLAAHLSYALKTKFPDGVLWARLDTSDTMSILTSFADAFGKSVSQYQDIDTRATAVRALLAHKRVLIILDNAEDSTQVRPLLPPSDSACAVLITTRNDLAVTDGWPVLLLDGFTSSAIDSLSLFEQFLGQACVQSNRSALNALAEALGHLPLALAIVAGRLRGVLRQSNPNEGGGALQHTQSAEIAFVLRQVQDESPTNLAHLQRDDQNVRRSFNISFDVLPTTLQRFFAQLSVFGGADFSEEAIAHVTQTTLVETHSHIESLRACSLLQLSHAGRYRLHPLLRNYARERLTQIDRQTEDCPRQMCDYFAGFVQQHEHETEYLDVEIDNIIFALHVAQDHRFDALLFRTAHDFQYYLEVRGDYLYGNVLYGHTIVLAEAQHNELELARSLSCLAAFVVRQSNYDHAFALAERGLRLAERASDAVTQILCLKALSSASLGRGKFTDDAAYSRRGLAIAREIDDRRLMSNMLVNLGAVESVLGNTAAGEAHQIEGRQLAFENGYPVPFIVVSLNLGELMRDQGRIEEALTYFEEGLALARQIGHREHQNNLLSGYGDLKSRLGSFDDAETLLRESLSLANDLNSPWLISTSRLSYANHLLRMGVLDQVETYLQEGLSAAQNIQAEELIGAGTFTQAKLYLARGRTAEALGAGQRALTLFTDQGHTKANEVREWLNQQRQT